MSEHSMESQAKFHHSTLGQAPYHRRGDDLTKQILAELPATMETLRDKFPRHSYGSLRNALALLRSQALICRGGFGYSAPYVLVEPLPEDRD